MIRKKWSVGTILNVLGRYPTSSRISLVEWTRWIRLFHILFASGLPVLGCLYTLRQSHQLRNHSLHSKTDSIITSIERGMYVSKGMNEADFPSLMVQILQVGEESGAFESSLQLLVQHYQQQLIWRRQVKRSLAYPLFVFVTSICVIVYITYFVLPQFLGLYQMMGVHTSNTLLYFIQIAKYGIPVIGSLFVIGIVFLRLFWNSFKQHRQAIAELYFQACDWPFIGNFLRIWLSKQFTDAGSILLQAGVTFAESIQFMSSSIHSPMVESIALACAEGIKEGISVRTMLAPFPFTYEFFAMLDVAEKTGQLADCFLQIAQLMDQEWKYCIELTIERLQPILLTGMGVIVGGIVLLVMLPMFQLIGAL